MHYTNYRSVRLLSPYAVPAAPVLLQVRYSDDASFVVASFDSPTDRAGLATQFRCDGLFNFGQASSFRCQWTDDSTVIVYVSGSSLINVGLPLFLSENTVKARCRDNILPPCSMWEYARPRELTISRPENPSQPKPQVAMPEIVGACSDVQIDLSVT